jgi:hypothetical protein
MNQLLFVFVFTQSIRIGKLELKCAILALKYRFLPTDNLFDLLLFSFYSFHMLYCYYSVDKGKV